MSQSKYHTKAPLSYSEKLCTRNLKQIKAVNKAYADAEVLIAITHKNQSSLLNRAVESAINQSLISQHKARIVILDDSSESIHVEELRRISEHPSITLLSAECGSAARARNTLLDWADRDPKLKWVARLDADDELAASNSVEALWARAQSSEVVAVVGSNGLRMNEIITSSPNLADPKVLLNQISLMEMVNRFCSGEQSHELPSCNLLLKTQLKERYPNVKSAEDHWLVLRLLFLHANQVACVTSPLYCIYSLNGNDTLQNKSDSSWSLQRQHLAVAGNAWLKAQKEHECILGVGMEGVVSRSNKLIIKEFYPWSLNDDDAVRIQQLLKNPDLPMPSITWAKSDGIWRYSTVEQNTKPVGTYLDYAQIHQFLIKLYKAKICALNIKRDNLLIDASNQLIYIEIGRDIRALTSSYFLDMSARLYSIGILGNDDEEMVRRFTLRTSEESFSELPGFAEFYRDLITTLNPVHPTTCQIKHTETLDDVTLLIKASAQDWEFIYAQVAHIVTQLSYPKRFKSVTLLIDSHVGHFLRQYASPDFETVLLEAQKLQAQGIIDVIWQSPTYNPAEAESSIRKTYKKWFNNDEIAETHTTSNAPLLPSIWAFDRLSTRYVLQCDLDVLVGRRDLNHDYISEMLDAIAPEDVQCVGFNIPKKSSEFLPYHGEAGQYPPEVRFGLLDLYRIKDSLPMENPVKDGKYTLTWHRALQAQQLQKGFRSVRGGNPTTFYIHPRNNDKSHLSSGVIRDLVSQALLPAEQAEQFDLQLTPPWCYPTRNEQVIFLLKGRMTPSEKLIG